LTDCEFCKCEMIEGDAEMEEPTEEETNEFLKMVHSIFGKYEQEEK